MDPNHTMEASLATMKKFFTHKGFCPDEDAAEKAIIRGIGLKKSPYTYEDVYKMFCTSIFRIALLDMLANIEQLSNNNPDLPLLLKLAAYRRNLLLGGLGDAGSAAKAKGRSILKAMQIYGQDIDPVAY